jgi:hypothetical protein
VASADVTAARAPSEASQLRTNILVGLGIALVVGVLLATAATRTQATATLGLVSFGLVFVAARRTLLAWPTLLGVLILVILLIPIKRYTLGGGLPFALEPYRILIAVIVGAWLGALLVDPGTRFRRLGFEWPIALIAVAILGSLLLNLDRVSSLSSPVVKAVTFFASFFFVMYLASSAVQDRRALDNILKLLVIGGVVVAVLAVYEWHAGRNIFNELERLIPVLDYEVPEQDLDPLLRGGNVRAYASAQHPIALGAALVMLMPLAVYLYRRTGQLVWMAAAAVLTAGALSTTSRTAGVMLVTELLVFLWLKRDATVRMLPALLPLALVVQIAMPGTLGTFKAIFFPKEGLIAEEQAEAGQPGSGRLADLGPSLDEWGRQPLLGQGFGTRLPSNRDGIVNAKILDDQWLSSLLEIGALGFIGLVWLFVRAVRRLGKPARSNDSPHGWLLTALAAAIAAYAVGMVTYDAFSFIQVTVLAFILLGLSGVALRVSRSTPGGLRPALGDPA